VAKYVAVSTREASLDVASMGATSTKVFVLEVMGRHAGWIAASAGLACEQEGDAPHIILLPEVLLDEARLYDRIQACVDQYGHCVIVVSEGLKNQNGDFLSAANGVDAFGHHQLGGVAPKLAGMIGDKLGLKYHWAVSDYLQRSARHIASATDVAQAYAVGEYAIKLALAGKSGIMPIIVREQTQPYKWSLGEAPLAMVANEEKKMPKEFISEDGFGITQAALDYLQPLIEGEDYPPYHNGLPIIARLKLALVPQKLVPFKA